MATIPTTDRKYYDTERKVNAVAEYAGALLPAAKQYQDFKNKQEEAKLKLKESQAKLDMNELTQAWRIQNMDDPSNPESLLQLQIEYDSILSQYREKVDPMFRNKWDSIGMNLKNNFSILNQNWGFKQSIDNEKDGFKIDAETTRKNVVFEKLTPKETSQKIRDEVTSKGGESFTSVPTQDVALTATNEAEKGFVDSFNYHLGMKNFGVIKAWLDEESETPPESRNVSDKTLNNMKKKLNTEWNKDLLRRYKNGEKLEVLQKEKPDFVPAKNVKQEKQNTVKKPKEMRHDDFQKLLKEKIRKLKKIHNEQEYLDLEDKEKDDYEFHVLAEMVDIKQQLMNSTKIKEEDKSSMLQILYATAYDETLQDDVLRIYENFNKITHISWFDGAKFLIGLGGDNNPPAAILHETQFDIANNGNKAAEQIINILSQVKPIDKESKPEDIEYNNNLISQADDVVLSFLKKTLTLIYGFDFVNNDLKVGDTIQIPHLSNRVYTFMGYTENDVLVKTIQ